MNNGKWVMGIVMTGVVVGGLWMRSVAARQWNLTRDFYVLHERALGDLEAVHRDLRIVVARSGSTGQDLSSLAASADLLVRTFEGIEPVNGRTDRTLQLERTYARTLFEHVIRPPGVATPSLLEVEVAYGAVVGPVMLENHEHRWTTFPVPGAMPTPRPKRVI